MKCLHVDSSILGPNSVSRMLTAEIVAAQRHLHPGLGVTYHDLATDPLPHLSPLHVAAWHGVAPDDIQVQEDLVRGAALLDEVFAADILVIGVPMYNFGIPSQLKAWIDRLCIAGRTFRYTPQGPEGLVTGKKLFLASTRGGAYGAETPMAVFEHQESYVKAVLGFIGLKDVTVIRAEGLAQGEEAKTAALAHARSDIAAL